MRYLLLLPLSFLLSCMENNQTHTSSTIQKIDTIKTQIANKDTIIQIKVNENELPKTITFSIFYNYQRVYIEIAGVNHYKIHATLNPKGINRNIRFNQIKLPDGTTDGPFGQKIDYKTSQEGNYTLIIGKDNMADGTLEGDATVSLSLQ